MADFGIIVHGGAGTHRDKNKAKEGVIKATEEGYKILEKGGAAIDAVCAAVCEMENNPYFNAGYGSALTATGEVELDAAIMIGNELKFGGVAGIRGFKNPILIARKVMEKTDHILLAGKGAEEFALIEGFRRENLLSEERFALYRKILSGEDTHLKDRMKETWKWIRQKYGIFAGDTVGACAVDKDGFTVAGTSTGGIFFKMEGRIGDTPCPGCGTYATPYCASSATGLGESIMKIVLTKYVCDRVEEGKSVSEACKMGIDYLEEKTKGRAGVIAISADCEFGYYMNTPMMPTAFIKKGDKEIKLRGI
jgi:beta-aspartyl-peptidase (threonine type)